MNNRTKKVTVTLEIPVDRDIGYIHTVKDKETWLSDAGMINPNHVVISLVQRKPRELKFRECIGRDYIDKGEYYTDNNHNKPHIWSLDRQAFKDEWREDNTTIWEFVDEC